MAFLHNRSVFALLLALQLLSGVCFAKKPKPKQPEPVHQPLISRPVQLLAQDNFNRAALGPNWRTPHDEVVLSDGELNAHIEDEVVEDGPVQRGTAVAKFAHVAQNIGVVCRVKSVSAQTTILGITRAGEGSGFMVTVALHKNGAVTVHDEQDSLATVPNVVELGKWNDVMIEIVGPRVVVQLNGKQIADEQSPSIQRFQKKGFAISAVRGEARLDNLMVGEVAPITAK